MATKSNNLGVWIRAKGDKFSGKPAAFPKKAKKSEAVDLTGGGAKTRESKIGSEEAPKEGDRRSEEDFEIPETDQED